jgi:hypothetical protein
LHDNKETSMAKQQRAIRLTLIGTAIALVAAACAADKMRSGVPTAPVDVIAAVAKYTQTPPEKVAAVIVLDLQGNPAVVFPEGTDVTYPKFPVQAATITNVDTVSSVGYTVNPTCTLVKIGGGIYKVCK